MAFKIFKQHVLRLDRETHHLDFLITCRDLGLIPGFLRIKSSFHRTNFGKSKHEYEFACLKSYIRKKYAVVDKINRLVYGYRNDGLYRTLVDELSDKEFDEALKKIGFYREVQEKNLNRRFENKIRKLTGDRDVYRSRPPSFDFINLSNRVFTEEESKILAKGPKHICLNVPSAKSIVPQFEDIIGNVPQESREETRNYIFWHYKAYTKRRAKVPRADHRFLKSLRDDPSIVILPTDKSNKFGVLNKSDYITKMERTIIEMNCQLVTGDPFPAFSRKVERLVKYNSWPDSIKPLVKTNKLGVIPAMFGVLKDHKANFPLRPIVGKHRSPSYFLEKALVPFLKDILPESQRVVTSTRDFISKLQQVQLPDEYLLATMDVVALFPSVDVDKAIDNISAAVSALSDLSSSEKSTVISALNLVIKNNYFVFDGKVYIQHKGAPMGSPISGLLSEFILRPFEESYISSAAIKPLVWFRFVDDVFIVWPGSKDTLKNFFEGINRIDPELQFTISYESNSSVPFMDVFLTKTATGISRKVYRKPVNSLCTIPATAAAPERYKMSAYSAYIHRALRVCTPENFHEELDNIREIASTNGYKTADINRLITKITNHIPNEQIDRQSVVRIPVTYIPGLHEKLSNYIRPFGIQLIAKTFPKIKDYLKVNIDPVPMEARAGVYQIPYEDANGNRRYYVGMTTRKLKTRLKEHKYDLRIGKETTALSREFIANPAITVKFDEARIVAPLESNKRTLMRESIEIFLRSGEVCNEQNSLDIPSLWKCLL